MKRILLSLVLFSVAGSISAQKVIDTVSLGAGYANQVWYSLENDNQATAQKGNWDIAFDVSSFGTSILINSMSGVELWEYNGDTADFATLDTVGLTGWTSRHNSDTSWSLGAFSQGANDAYLGWGKYNTITHAVEGDLLFVIKLTNGNYQKIWIKSLAGGKYTFRHASLDNMMDMTHTLDKAKFSDRNFGYFSLVNHSDINREPSNTDWDILFTQYNAFVPSPYNVSGVLSNRGVYVAKAYPIKDVETYEDYKIEIFTSSMSGIGHDWKSFSGGNWSVEDSLVYFVQTNEGIVWKMIFTGFGGSTNGNFIFSKEKVGQVGVEDVIANTEVFDVYPNPARENMNIVFNSNGRVNMSIYSITGNLMKEKIVSATSGLNTYNLDLSGIQSGVYLLQLNDGRSIATKRIIVE